MIVDSTRTRAVEIGPDNVAYAVTWRGRLLRSKDVGATWIDTDIERARWVTICPDNRIFVGAETGFITSSDNGQTWNGPYASRHVRVLACTSDANLIVEAGGIYAFHPDSLSFDSLYRAPENTYFSVFSFIRTSPDSLHMAYAGCQELSCGTVVNSLDGGQTFADDDSWPYNGAAFSIAKTSSGTIVVSADGGVVRRQISSSEWTHTHAPDASFAQDLISLGGDSLLVAGYGGIAVSVDGGQNWRKLTSMPGKDIAFRSGLILVATDFGILRLRGAIPTAIDLPFLPESAAVQPTLRAYPNPFQTWFKLNYEGFECSPDISVFDLAGRTVLTRQSVGESDEVIVGSSMASGPVIIRACCKNQCSSARVIRAAN